MNTKSKVVYHRVLFRLESFSTLYINDFPYPNAFDAELIHWVKYWYIFTGSKQNNVGHTLKSFPHSEHRTRTENT